MTVYSVHCTVHNKQYQVPSQQCTVEEVLAKISEDQVLPKINSKAGAFKNISMKLHSKGGVYKTYFHIQYVFGDI